MMDRLTQSLHSWWIQYRYNRRTHYFTQAAYRYIQQYLQHLSDLCGPVLQSFYYSIHDPVRHAHENTIRHHKQQIHALLLQWHALLAHSQIQLASSYQPLTANLENLYHAFLNCAQLRHRLSVPDATLLSTCQPEMIVLIHPLSRYLREVGHSSATRHANTPSPYDEQITNALSYIENHYENILEVSMQKPSALIIFILSVRAFQQAITDFHTAFSALCSL